MEITYENQKKIYLHPPAIRCTSTYEAIHSFRDTYTFCFVEIVEGKVSPITHAAVAVDSSCSLIPVEFTYIIQ